MRVLTRGGMWISCLDRQHSLVYSGWLYTLPKWATMTITELQNKIIKLEDFFKSASGELRKKTGLTRFHFLMLDDKSGKFVTKYSTCGSYISFAKKKLCHLSENSKVGILYPKMMIQRSGFLSRIILKIYWQIQMFNVSAIAPIYQDSEVICLILFSDRMADDWLIRHSHYVNALQREITHCLDAILLYNQTLEGIIKEYDRSYKRPSCCATPISDEQVPMRIGKKVEFL